MLEIPPPKGPYHFTEQDLSPDRIKVGAEQTLDDFFKWRDNNPQRVAEHIDDHTRHLQSFTEEYGTLATLQRRLRPSRQEQFEKEALVRDIGFFCVYNLGEVPDKGKVDLFSQSVARHPLDFIDILQDAGKEPNVVSISEAIGHHIPALAGQPELRWLDAQMTRLQQILPEAVIQNGGMGKAARTMAGVLLIGLYDTLDDPVDVRRQHLTRILPSAYAYGAMYPIIDDTLQDSHYVSERDKTRYHETILSGIRTGEAVHPSDLPDHPLAEELEGLYRILLDAFPFDEYRHLYAAGESMYLAQDRDSRLTSEDVALRGLKAIYPDMFVKASMTRVVANILGRRTVKDGYYGQAININFINQLRDDLQDHRDDEGAGRVTPFTSMTPESDTNPLHDLFSYSTYVADQLFDNNPEAVETLTNFSARRLAIYFLKDPVWARHLSDEYSITEETRRFIRQAAAIPSHASRRLQRPDIQFQDAVTALSRNRAQTEIDPRTFVSDRRDYIEKVLREGYNGQASNPLNDAVVYAMEAGGKRLRPALTLMLAESMGMDYRTIEPLLRAVELFHTSSLVFDDLPAQDDASLRRGEATTHIAFGEGRAQLAGIAMMSSGFGMLSGLADAYPADKVTAVLDYFGSVLGPQRLCLGQDMDLHMMDKPENHTTEAIIEMYNLKTSTLIEASLVPLMMLNGNPASEIDLMKQYAYHTGIVFQIRDDILDITSSSDELGKDNDNDINKVNIARLNGIETAQKLMEEHLEAAVACCQELPFNTHLLQSIVSHFASRKS
jgi:geranylgeranyl pyrophosphate synthase